ncbi:FtsK/SpoIIIE family DNA translocase [Govanella unica]|uniref:DNA translocase FtsK n=1 Tax=Govanella unica TaxID=2975056 RepID=A0A9X3Z5X9_9PROT|nr:DNA translocase FtsK 4TM domain-containing protein [Govania unica]MDA5192438.1 DNA translocase FtsK 4TM domain-containing protein [Govania unica]
MARAAAKSRKKKPLLPENVTVFLRRRLVEGAGVFLWLLFVAGFLALISYSSNDPGWNNATNVMPVNWLGVPGAYVADLLLQTLGLGALLLILPLLPWGLRILTHRGLPLIGAQLVALPVAVLFLVMALTLLPTPGLWPVDAGFGGSLGFVLMNLLEGVVSRLGLGLYPWIYGSLIGIIGLLVYLFALDLTRSEWAAIGRVMARIMKIFAATLATITRGAAHFWPKPKFPSRSQLKAKADRMAALKPDLKLTRKEPALGKAGDAVAVLPDEPEEDEDLSPRVEDAPRIVKPGKRAERERQPTLDFGPTGEFRLPPLDLLTKAPPRKTTDKVTAEALEQNARMLESVLDDFGVKGEITAVRPGPVVTLYELEPAPGTKSARVIGLAHDIARSMSAVSARVAVVPGRNAIGIELPNSTRETVYLRELLDTQAYEDASARLLLALGKDIGGEPAFADLATMPHSLVAGTTGSGKSVAINAMILSLLYRLTPAECRLIMVDPKMLELSVYDGIPHLLTPVVTDPRKAVVALKWAVREMEDRYRSMSKLGVRNLKAYNKRVAEAAESGEVLKRRVQTGFNRETGEPVYEEELLDPKPLPMIVVIVDEMADLMLVAGKDIEGAVQRLAQMARAAGIHLIMATQRPSVDVITGTIKANFPTRMSFQVTSKIDSRTILGEQGAEQLLGQGDMLYMAGGGRITRVHGPFVSDGEVEEVVNYLKAQGAPEYLEDITEEPEEGGFDAMMLGTGEDPGEDLYDRAVAIVARDRKASTSYIQRQLQIGYNRAANLIERMEREGVVSTANHAGKREILIGDHG